MKSIDKDLIDELLKDSPEYNKIKSLILNGANINIRFGEYNSNILDKLLEGRRGGENEKIDINKIRFCLENGLDLKIMNHVVGFNYLFDACMLLRPDIVELLLQYGSDPNCISEDNNEETLLDWISEDIYFEEVIERFNQYTEEDIKKYKECEKLLIKYGGKYFREIE